MPDEGLEREVLDLRARLVAAEADAVKWKMKFERERKRRLHLDKALPRNPPVPRLYTVGSEESGNLRQIWMYRANVITDGLGVQGATFYRWIRAGRIPESDYRDLCGNRLWTKEQVELIFEVIERHRRVNAFALWAAGHAAAEIRERWVSVNPEGAQSWASRQRHFPVYEAIKPKVTRKGEQHGNERRDYVGQAELPKAG
jgi:hypothetical protein